MLSKPQFGWTDITIGDWRDRASYLTNVPNDILNALFMVLGRKCSISSAFFNAEGWEYIITFGWKTTYIITESNEVRFYAVNKDLLDIAEEVYNDINKDIDAWCSWNFRGRETKKSKLKHKLEKLKRLIEENKRGDE